MNIIKVNKSHYIALFVVSGSVKKLFSIDYVIKYLYVNILPGGKVWGYSPLLYRDSFT